jgi:uncharacterized protein YdeI (YjbR/CyaY-like superfamily)
MAPLDTLPLVPCERREEWRAWLQANHATAPGAWLVTWRRSAGRPILPYEEAVEEALCFGWVDGRVTTADPQRQKLHFAPRRPGSGWARSNRDRVERLLADGLMTPAGLAVVERARADGSWLLYVDTENLVIPADLAAALAANPPAAQHWAAFSPSARRLLLEWIRQARRPATRAARIVETAACAARNEKANQGPRRPLAP